MCPLCSAPHSLPFQVLRLEIPEFLSVKLPSDCGMVECTDNILTLISPMRYVSLSTQANSLLGHLLNPLWNDQSWHPVPLPSPKYLRGVLEDTSHDPFQDHLGILKLRGRDVEGTHWSESGSFLLCSSRWP